MATLLIIAVAVWLLIRYVLNLKFEIGSGFSEAKKNIREVEYRVVTDEEKAREKRDAELLDEK